MDDNKNIAILEDFQKKASSVLKELDEYLKKDFNCFDVLAITDVEIRHSNVLAFLLDCQGSHKLKDTFIKEFFKLFNLENNKEVINYCNFKVMREFLTDKNKRIDILLKNDEEKIVVVIENKIYSSDYENQLSKYRTFIEKKFKGYSITRLYLTLDGKIPNDSAEEKKWNLISHIAISEIVESIISKENINNKVKFFLEDYVEVIRRLTMKDQKLIDLCNKIYADNKTAMDLIYRNRDNSYLKNIVDKYLKIKRKDNKIIYPLNNKIDLAFRTSDLKKYVSSKVKGVIDYYYIIEIVNTSIDVYLYFNPEKEVYNFEEKYFAKYIHSLHFRTDTENDYPKKSKNPKLYFCNIGRYYTSKLDFNDSEKDEEKIFAFLDKILDKLIV